jgi:Tfp pilus assembly protein PilF
MKDYDKAIELDPKDAEAYHCRAVVYEELGDHQNALKDYKTAAKLGSKDAQKYLKTKGVNW